MKEGSGGSGYLDYSENKAGQRRPALICLIAGFLPFAIILHVYFSYSSSSFYTTIISAPLSYNYSTQLPSSHASETTVEGVINTTTTSAPLSYSHSTQPASSHAAETAVEGVINTGEQCDLFRGEWIPEPAGPFYTNASCRDIPDHQNCMKNGRPDSGYLYWRWKPDGCDLPRFNASRFLHIVRNKIWGFIGDSIARNNVQSLVCLLSQVEDPMDVYHDEAYMFRRWYFPSHNFTLVVSWSPYLIKISEDEVNGLPKDIVKLYLDTIDESWKYQLHEFDFIILSGGEWFYKSSICLEKNKVVGCHYCPGLNLTELEIPLIYRKALRLAFKFITSSPNYKGLTFFRTFTSDHFENGEWFSGGTCNRTVPFQKDQFSMPWLDAEMRKVELEEFEEAAKEGFSRGLKFKLLDTSQALLLRPDGHPGPYRYYYPFANNSHAKVQNDCLHWCLPGPIDSWSEILLEILQHE